MPFPKQFDGTQVLVGGVALPLRYVSSMQVNAQIPFEIALNTALQLTIQRDATLSVPLNVIVASAQPGIYTQDSSGMGAGVIVNASQSYSLVTAQTPASAGDVLVIYWATNYLTHMAPSSKMGSWKQLTSTKTAA